MKIFEIGVGHLYHCRTKQFINTNVECYLFEPNPVCFEELKSALSNYPNFKLFNYAVGSENKTCNLCLAGPSSFLEGISSPQKSYQPNAESELEKVSIEIRSIKEIDNGDIDFLLLDTEGSEFDIIKNLVSRPKQISVEMYSFGVGYKNPHFDDIMNWMNENNYEIVDNTWNPQTQPIGEDYIFQLKDKS
jgi:FkbM family methyltransferase